jgi:photosystem II stability/assembly factor-like uncharacterized protein
MQKFLIIFLFTGYSLTFGESQWEIARFVPWRGVYPFYDVEFLPGTQMGWAVGCAYRDTNWTYYGSVAHTSDGGRTWVPQMADGNAICFVDGSHGWIAGDSGIIYRTTNGGVTWSRQTTPITKHLYAVTFIDTLRGWAFGLYGYVLHTEDGGNNWSVQYHFPDSLWIMDGIFKDSITGWVCGYSGSAQGKIYKTTDGGDTWILQNPGTNGNFYGIDFYDLNLGWAVTSGLGIVTNTTNGGSNWFPQLVIDYSLLDVKFADASNGWVVGGENDGRSAIFYSSDGGITWIEQNNPTYNELWAVSASSNNEAYAVGRYGTILHTSDGGNNWEYQAGGGSNHLINIDAPDTLNIWAVGDWERTVLHSRDGGLTWEHQMVGPGYGYLWDVSFADSLNGATVGGSGLIYITNDGGRTWTQRSAGGINYAWWGVEWVGPSKGWIADVNSGVIKYTSDGGNTWTTQYSGIYFCDVMFLNDTLGWACGFTFGYSKVAKTINGQTWVSYTIPTYRILTSIDFVSPDIGFVVGENGEIYKSIDGGVTWVSLANDTIGTNDLYKVDFVDSLNGWIISSGKIFRTRDGGNTWCTERILPYSSGANNFRGLVALDTLHAWACMSDGIILRYGLPVPGVKEANNIETKRQGEILDVSPNPFRNGVSIKFQIPDQSAINSNLATHYSLLATLKIYDATGKLVKQFNHLTIQPFNQIIWDGSDNSGHPVPSGVYFVNLKTPKKSITKKVIFLGGVR